MKQAETNWISNITSLKQLQLRDVDSIKVVDNLPFLSELLLIANCEGLERVSNIPQVRELRAQLCPNLSCVERLDSLHQLFLNEDMQDISSRWLSGSDSKIGTSSCTEKTWMSAGHGDLGCVLSNSGMYIYVPCFNISDLFSYPPPTHL